MLLCQVCFLSVSIQPVAFACMCRPEELCRKAYKTGKSFQKQLLGDNRSLFVVCCFSCSSMGAHWYWSPACMCCFLVYRGEFVVCIMWLAGNCLFIQLLIHSIEFLPYHCYPDGNLLFDFQRMLKTCFVFLTPHWSEENKTRGNGDPERYRSRKYCGELWTVNVMHWGRYKCFILNMYKSSKLASVITIPIPNISEKKFARQWSLTNVKPHTWHYMGQCEL